MRIIKLTKRNMKSPEDLLIACGAVIGRQSYPWAVFINPKDYKILTKNVKNLFIKEYKTYIFKRSLKISVNMHMLNYGPVVSDAIQQGKALVIDDLIGDKDNNERN